MKNELELWQFAATRLKSGRSVVLLVVAESSGSSPGRQGFKMIVAENDLAGSVGGGAMEVNLVEQAKAQISNSDVQIIEQVHRKKSSAASGMICSGRQTVIVYRLNSSHLKIVREIVRALKNQQPKILQISNFKLEIADGQAKSFDFKFELSGEDEFLYQEKLGFKNRLFIVGGGHCALAVSEIMSKMDFHITLFDDRPNLNTLSKNKFVHAKKIVASYAEIDRYISSGANHFVVVMTLGYKSDAIVIRKLLAKDFKYFGVLGSRAKMTTLLKDLKKEGFSAEKLNRIRTPIGLPINSRTPVEIAVSIAAEIINVKNKLA